MFVFIFIPLYFQSLSAAEKNALKTMTFASSQHGVLKYVEFWDLAWKL
jgi:hypothetical protein